MLDVDITSVAMLNVVAPKLLATVTNVEPIHHLWASAFLQAVHYLLSSKTTQLRVVSSSQTTSRVSPVGFPSPLGDQFLPKNK